MRFDPTPLPGAWVIDLDPIEDERGYFARAFDAEAFADHDIDPTIVQSNLSHTLAAGTFRGFHWQAPPAGEAKTVRCISGRVLDVIVDMRPDSPTHRQWFGVELSAENRRALHIPEQVANGFLILEDATTLLYHVNRPHTPGHERGFRHDDPAIAVAWPRPIVHVSDKDAAWPDLES